MLCYSYSRWPAHTRVLTSRPAPPPPSLHQVLLEREGGSPGLVAATLRHALHREKTEFFRLMAVLEAQSAGLTLRRLTVFLYIFSRRSLPLLLGFSWGVTPLSTPPYKYFVLTLPAKDYFHTLLTSILFSPSFEFSVLTMYVYMYMHTCIHKYKYIYIYE